jgi:glucose-6-phosphate isomerase
MLNLDLGNIYVDESVIKPLLNPIRKKEQPELAGYKEDISSIKRALQPYMRLKNLIIIGQGGSINSFKAIYHPGFTKLRKNSLILNTNDPDQIEEAKKSFGKSSTLVMCISKSGETVSSIEALLAFKGYKTVIVTENKKNTLYNIAKKRKWKIIIHPDIGGRYSGFTSCNYAPLIFMGFDATKLDKGAAKMYMACDPENGFEENPALQLATAMFLLEMQGYTEVYCPIYSSKLASFLPLIVQLMHESTCKNGRGMTFYGDMGPECQHHTNQRFFGGRKNVMGLFTRIKAFEHESSVIDVPKDIENIELKAGNLKIMHNLPYSKALDFEFLGVREHTIHYKIPYAIITLDKATEETMGELMAFWHYVAIYSSWLRNVNPFDQPEVEFSKKQTFELTRGYRR